MKGPNMTEWNQAITAALGALPCGEKYEWIADRVRGLMRDETPHGLAMRNIGRAVRWDNQTGTIRGVRTNPGRKDRLCYLIAGCFGTVERPVESVEVV